MVVVNKSLVSLSEKTGSLLTEASTIGLGPGEWPDFISVVDDAGNGFLFLKGTVDRRDGDITAVHYLTRDGLGLVVFND